MHWIKSNWTLSAVYLIFITCAIMYGWQKRLYADVESWPSVLAQDVNFQIVEGEIRKDNWYAGTKQSSTYSESVSFKYVVNGKTYCGHLTSPDGSPAQREYEYDFKETPKETRTGNIPFRQIQKPWRAYYHPDRPSLAVLNNSAYKGLGYLLTMAFTGLLILIHLITEIKLGKPKTQQS